MIADSSVSRMRRAGAEKTETSHYTAKDFQLEVLSKLEEVQSLAEGLEHGLDRKLEAGGEQRLVRVDSRAMIALGAIALSITGYVIQEARTTARQDSEIEATKARMMRLEQIAATNTESRIRTEVQLGELRDGQAEIKMLIQARDGAGRKTTVQK